MLYGFPGFFMWIKLIYFFRFNEKLGRFVHVIQEIITDIGSFILFGIFDFLGIIAGFFILGDSLTTCDFAASIGTATFLFISKALFYVGNVVYLSSSKLPEFLF